jgi:hypothetical protein
MKREEGAKITMKDIDQYLNQNKMIFNQHGNLQESETSLKKYE